MLGSCQSSVLSGSKMLFHGLNGQFEDLNVSNLLKEGFFENQLKNKTNCVSNGPYGTK